MIDISQKFKLHLIKKLRFSSDSRCTTSYKQSPPKKPNYEKDRCRCSSQSVSDSQERTLKNIKTIKMPTMNSATILKFAKMTDKAYAPMKGSKSAAGYDLRSAYEYTVPARGKELVKTDLQIEVPEGTYGRIAPRSGLAWKNSIDVGAGVIDADYRGNVGVVLFNFGNEDFKISPGDRVAQLICEKIVYPELEENKNLDNTERGEGGFGSTGKN